MDNNQQQPTVPPDGTQVPAGSDAALPPMPAPALPPMPDMALPPPPTMPQPPVDPNQFMQAPQQPPMPAAPALPPQEVVPQAPPTIIPQGNVLPPSQQPDPIVAQRELAPTPGSQPIQPLNSPSAPDVSVTDPDQIRNQVVDDIQSVDNILVTVSTNPTVDELSAALGLALILDKLEKRSAAVFSGATPPAITFLYPEKTFEDSADSLRDFIIALDKEKADHLRYKVEGDLVKIFITPYKTVLSEKDLDFTQGEFNIELVLALGVTSSEQLDASLDAHENILHDAKVVTLTTGDTRSNLGSVDWHDEGASGLSELVVSLADQLAPSASETLLDEQIATALLTGIVSATERFSNDRTNSNSMTMAAELMAAGANQQLIAAKLAEAHDIKPGRKRSVSQSSSDSDGAQFLNGGTELSIEHADEPNDSSSINSFNPENTGPSYDSPVDTLGGDDSLADLQNSISSSLGLSSEKVIEPLAKPTEEIESKLSEEESDQLDLEKQLAGITGGVSGGGSDLEQDLDQAVNESQLPEMPTSVLPPVPADLNMPDFEQSPAPTSAPTDDTVMPALPPLPVTPGDTPENSVDATPSDNLISGHQESPASSGTPVINGIQNLKDEQVSINPFDGPKVGTETPIGGGTDEMASLLSAPVREEDGSAPGIGPIQSSIKEAHQVPETPGIDIPGGKLEEARDITPPSEIGATLPPLPPLPGDLGGATLPPPPPPPVFNTGGGQSGAVSGDIFGSTQATESKPADTPVEASPAQFKIPTMS